MTTPLLSQQNSHVLNTSTTSSQHVATPLLSQQDENDYFSDELYNAVPVQFLSGRIFHYEFTHEQPLINEMQNLYGLFYNACYKEMNNFQRFVDDPHNNAVSEKYTAEISPSTVDFRRLPLHWPDRQTIWQNAVATCPHHMFNTGQPLTNGQTNYLLYGCDPNGFRLYVVDNRLGLAEQHYQWNGLFGHAETPEQQLQMLVGVDMMAQGREYYYSTPALRVLPIFFGQIQQYRNNNRLLPNKSITNWIDYAPPKDWQLLQALTRSFISKNILSCWVSILNYTGAGYKVINWMLRNNPNMIDRLGIRILQRGTTMSTQDAAWRIQWLMALSPVLPKPCIVYRYHKGHISKTFGPILGLKQAKSGFEYDQWTIEHLRQKSLITTHGFTSTTINLDYVLSKLIADQPHHLLEIYLPPGTHCCSWPSQEYELILPHRSVLQFVDSYLIGTDFSHPRDLALVGNLTPSQQENVEQIRVLVFQLVFDGIEFANDTQIPEQVRQTAMQPPPVLYEYQPYRQIIYAPKRYRSLTTSDNGRRRRTVTLQRGHSANSRLVAQRVTNNLKKRQHTSSSRDNNGGGNAKKQLVSAV